MTTTPPKPPRIIVLTRAAVANLAGLLLLIAGLIAIPILVWHLAPYAAATVLVVYATAVGGWLATHDFRERS